MLSSLISPRYLCRRQNVSFNPNVNTREQWAFLLEGLPNVLETPIHGSIGEYEVCYLELLI